MSVNRNVTVPVGAPRTGETLQRARYRGPWDNRELVQASQNETVAVAPMQFVHRHREAEVGEALEQRTEREFSFHARKGRAEAEVNAVTESEMPGVGPLDVEIVGFGEM